MDRAEALEADLHYEQVTLADASGIKGYNNNTAIPDGTLVYAPGTETQAFAFTLSKRLVYNVLLGRTSRRREAAGGAVMDASTSSHSPTKASKEVSRLTYISVGDRPQASSSPGELPASFRGRFPILESPQTLTKASNHPRQTMTKLFSPGTGLLHQIDVQTIILKSLTKTS
ncbi:hypothetical protein M407DRAFT_18474 [Tulasnella calospora MUT 4182]|uniref:Uncharacterized protein n=1 Tax=Tulasnella calospora MUT 4182 TaxID=1051891 RepID=A0A0C3QVL3_9AGAM|nr:hypothetical protein M407DRAFT_18474 [Tulasnella calospora MUT 4182]